MLHTYNLGTLGECSPFNVIRGGTALIFTTIASLFQLCDISLRAGVTTLSAHRVVLAAASPYFHAMFNGKLLLIKCQGSVFSQYLCSQKYPFGYNKNTWSHCNLSKPVAILFGLGPYMMMIQFGWLTGSILTCFHKLWKPFVGFV